MKLGITMALGGLALATAATAALAALTPEDLFAQRSLSIFVVHVYEKSGKKLGTGSGVVIGKEQVITNCHVLAKASIIRVSRGNISLGATLEYPDPERDLCQLKVKELTAPAVPMTDLASVKIGQRVYAIGAPRGLELSLTEGIVSSLRGGDEDNPHLPPLTLDAVLIVDTYHEMDAHQQILQHIKTSLRVGGRLVICEPISEERKKIPRDEQERKHELGMDYAIADAVQAGFKVIWKQESFVDRVKEKGDMMWLIVCERSN